MNPPVLTRRIMRNLLTQQVEEPEEEILCRNVRSFSLRYWDGTMWQDTWDSTQLENALPLAVEMTLVIEHPGQRGIMEPVKIIRLIPLAVAQPLEDTTAGGAQ
jgi:hypothetical protein